MISISTSRDGVVRLYFRGRGEKTERGLIVMGFFTKGVGGLESELNVVSRETIRYTGPGGKQLGNAFLQQIAKPVGSFSASEQRSENEPQLSRRLLFLVFSFL
jgi:hypothetical protein